MRTAQITLLYIQLLKKKEKTKLYHLKRLHHLSEAVRSTKIKNSQDTLKKKIDE